jgi:hypothetical protein
MFYFCHAKQTKNATFYIKTLNDICLQTKKTFLMGHFFVFVFIPFRFVSLMNKIYHSNLILQLPSGAMEC